MRGRGRPLRRAAERFQVSPTTAQRWAAHYGAGMTDRPSRPHRTGACGHQEALATSPTAVAERPSAVRRAERPLRTGYSHVRTAVDDHSSLAYSEILADERQETATAFKTRAHAFFASAGITVERVLTDNGSCYKPRLWHDTLAWAGIGPSHRHRDNRFGRASSRARRRQGAPRIIRAVVSGTERLDSGTARQLQARCARA